jgi:uncharacterized protein (DUF2062 family)
VSANVITHFFRRRIGQPVMNLLKQGMTPHKLASTLAVGTTLGVVPMFGVTTVLVTALAARFRLNIAATVLVSYLVHPLQLLLMIPFVKVGIFMFGMAELKMSLDEMLAMFRMDWLEALNKLWLANLAAVSAWAIMAMPIGVLLYYLLLPLLHRLLPKPVIVVPIPVEEVSVAQVSELEV